MTERALSSSRDPFFQRLVLIISWLFDFPSSLSVFRHILFWLQGMKRGGWNWSSLSCFLLLMLLSVSFYSYICQFLHSRLTLIIIFSVVRLPQDDHSTSIIMISSLVLGHLHDHRHYYHHPFLFSSAVEGNDEGRWPVVILAENEKVMLPSFSLFIVFHSLDLSLLPSNWFSDSSCVLSP